MAFSTFHNVSPKGFYSFRLKGCALSFHAWKRLKVFHERDVHLIPNVSCVFRKGGTAKLLKAEVSWGIWTANVSWCWGV